MRTNHSSGIQLSAMNNDKTEQKVNIGELKDSKQQTKWLDRIRSKSGSISDDEEHEERRFGTRINQWFRGGLNKTNPGQATDLNRHQFPNDQSKCHTQYAKRQFSHDPAKPWVGWDFKRDEF